MLQKIYWLGQVQSEHIKRTQEFRTLFCQYEFPYLTFLSPAFLIVGGGFVSNAYAWTLVINNNYFFHAGSVMTPVDEVSEQIRRLMILRLNLFFGKSPEEVENHCNKLRPVGSNLLPKKILPDVFSDASKSPKALYQEIGNGTLNSWFDKVLSLDPEKYDTVCQALAAYERALHVLSSDPALSYCLVVFAIEALANSHSEYHPTWDDVRGEPRKLFDTLFEDDRISSIDASWTEDLRKVLVNVLHPGATRRFTKFALDHISDDLYDESQSGSKCPLRRSRIRQSIENAYVLRSSFSHALKPLPQLLINESYRAEEVEEDGQTYLTLRGLFRVARFIVLEFIEQQKTEDLRSYPWDKILSHGEVNLSRMPAYIRMKNPHGQLYPMEAQHTQNWFEDILQIYQDNYIECLHSKIAGSSDQDHFLGIATSGSNRAGTMLFRFDPSPSYNWEALKEQSLRLIPQAKKDYKGYLQAITLLCTHLEMLQGKERKLDDVFKDRRFGNPLLGLERFVVDVINDKTKDWSGQQAEKVFEKYQKKRKVILPTRVEIACMLELARLFYHEGSKQGRQKWLKAAYGDSALYSDLQRSILSALDSDDIVVKPQEVLTVV